MSDAISPELARQIRLVLLDVDGVLTDGGVYLGAAEDGTPVELKRFHIQDGLGIKMLQWAGIEVVLVSGRISAATELRARELGVEECHQAPGGFKLAVVRDILERKGVAWEETALVADDLADLPVFSRVALPVAVPNACPEILDAARWCTPCGGGHGAVRALARRLLEARGEWSQRVEAYCRERGGVEAPSEAAS